MSIRKYKRKLKAAILRIYNHDADCGHKMLKNIRPDWYVEARKWYDLLKSVDPTCPEMPEWMGWQRHLIEANEELAAQTARADAAEKALLTAFRAIESLPVDSLGVVPETHRAPAYPIRDELLHRIVPPIRHLVFAKEDKPCVGTTDK